MREDWSYEVNSMGYQITFKGFNVGGAGYAQSVRKPDYKTFCESAESTKRECIRLDEKFPYEPGLWKNMWDWKKAAP
jgi:hypothetical protein